MSEDRNNHGPANRGAGVELRDSGSPDPALLRLAELEEAVALLTRKNRELARANARLELDAAFLDKVLESIPYPFYVIDATTYRIVIANSAARFGELGEATTCYALTHGERGPCQSAEHPCPLEEMRRTRKPVVVEHLHVAADGQRYHVEVHAFPILDENGELLRAIEYSIDISRRKAAEAERERYVGELEEALNKVRTLHRLLPICASCKKIRDDTGYWQQVEEYLSEHSDAQFSHSYCPDCAEAAMRALRKRE